MTFRLPFFRFSRVSKCCFFAAIVAAGVGQASGELWLYEGFDYTPGMELHQVVPDESSFGFTGPWTSSETFSGHADVIGSTGLSYGSLLTRGLSLQSFAPDPAEGGWSDTLTSSNRRSVDPSITIPTSGAATIWVSFLLQRNSRIWNGEHPLYEQDFATLFLVTTGGVGNVAIGEMDKLDALGIAQRDTTVTGEGDPLSLGVGVTKLIVLKLEMNAGPNNLEMGSLFVNPVIGQADPGVDPVAQMAVNLPNLPSIRFNTGFSGTEFIFDELRIGSTYESVTPVVPEPTSLLLLGTAGAVLVGSRRRRK